MQGEQVGLCASRRWRVSLFAGLSAGATTNRVPSSVSKTVPFIRCALLVNVHSLRAFGQSDHQESPAADEPWRPGTQILPVNWKASIALSVWMNAQPPTKFGQGRGHPETCREN